MPLALKVLGFCAVHRHVSTALQALLCIMRCITVSMIPRARTHCLNSFSHLFKAPTTTRSFIRLTTRATMALLRPSSAVCTRQASKLRTSVMLLLRFTTRAPMVRRALSSFTFSHHRVITNEINLDIFLRMRLTTRAITERARACSLMCLLHEFKHRTNAPCAQHLITRLVLQRISVLSFVFCTHKNNVLKRRRCLNRQVTLCINCRSRRAFLYLSCHLHQAAKVNLD